MDRRRFLMQGSTLLAAGLLTPRSLLASTDIPNALESLHPKPLRRIAFGSCNRSLSGQNHWPLIGQKNPDLWVWLGDNIYADYMTMDQRVALYTRLFEDSYYKRFRYLVPIVGVWDDHDYAQDNCDGSFPEKDQSKKALLDFLEVPYHHPARNDQPGVYQSYYFGPRGKRTQLVLLDLRYNMDRSRTEKTLLGDTQWAWFEEELRSSDADLLIIGSSLNVTSKVTGFGIEGWNSFGQEKQKLYNLLAEIQKPTVLLSGDRHFAEMAQVELSNGHKIYEAMSSGMTHSLGLHLPHSGRIGKMVGWRNFGLLEIDWDSTGPQVRSSICSTTSKDIYEQATFGWR